MALEDQLRLGTLAPRDRPAAGDVDFEVEGANDPSDPFPAVPTLLTIADDFGGWSATNDKFFGDEGLVTKIQAETGKQ